MRTKTVLTYRDVVHFSLALPGVEESTSYGTPALKVRGKLMVRLKEDQETVVLRTTWEERERLMTLYPDVFFLTDHYRAHPWVLMRLAAAPPANVPKWLHQAWLLAAPKSLSRQHPELGT